MYTHIVRVVHSSTTHPHTSTPSIPTHTHHPPHRHIPKSPQRVSVHGPGNLMASRPTPLQTTSLPWQRHCCGRHLVLLYGCRLGWVLAVVRLVRASVVCLVVAGYREWCGTQLHFWVQGADTLIRGGSLDKRRIGIECFVSCQLDHGKVGPQTRNGTPSVVGAMQCMRERKSVWVCAQIFLGM